MEALLCRKIGDPTVPISEASPISISVSHPIPELNSPTAIRVKVKATSLNYANYLQILGKYQEKPPLPFIPGSDYSGVVEAVGNKVSKFKILCWAWVLCRVCCCRRERNGCDLRFYFSFKIWFFVPDGCDLVAAGVLPVAFGTSHAALVHRAQLRTGQVLLVLGAAGGVGLSAVQIGKVCEVHLFTPLVLGAEKVQFLKSMGVDHVVDLSKGSVIESVKEFLKARKLKGVDVLYDPVGGKLTKESMKLLSWGANILIIGLTSGEVPIILANIALVKNWTIHGLYWGSYKINQPGVLEDPVKELLSWLARGLITIHISHTYSLPEASLAFSAIKERKAIGKVMIAFDDHKTVRSNL
ncbi:hypothetical protein HHK36_014721 [Tetracentron sinense]|uniref:Enoyl reductase (ER) domain-containing protein n=1 Tax=Tetracentron sinense TaxID=13715 RepID=A0A834Z9M5_TETSI|nr:hypothetical protein HHK36_014721 [Tetracentron sinense]